MSDIRAATAGKFWADFDNRGVADERICLIAALGCHTGQSQPGSGTMARLMIRMQMQLKLEGREIDGLLISYTQLRLRGKCSPSFS
jgi:hypothetical protein